MIAAKDRWGRSIENMEGELASAHEAMDAAASDTSRAYETWQLARTDSQERKGQVAWERAHTAQNAAARRLHAANQALGRPARDDRRKEGGSDDR